jgi:LysR family pca operon transcriptional activator
LRSSSHNFIRELLLATDRISVMPRSMMMGDLLRGAMRVVPLPVPAPPRYAGIILPAEPPLSPATAAFVGALRAYAAGIAARGLGGMLRFDTSGRRSNRTRRPGRA